MDLLEIQLIPSVTWASEALVSGATRWSVALSWELLTVAPIKIPRQRPEQRPHRRRSHLGESEEGKVQEEAMPDECSCPQLASRKTRRGRELSDHEPQSPPLDLQ